MCRRTRPHAVPGGRSRCAQGRAGDRRRHGGWRWAWPCRKIIPARVSRKRPILDYPPAMIGLTVTQLKIVMNAARLLPVEKRDTFLQRIAAMLAVRGRGR
jgi:hypothetical protein